MTRRVPEPFPDGINASHLKAGTAARIKSWLPLPMLGGVLLLAMTGLFGGGPPRHETARSNAASLSVEAPAILRNGQIFEVQLSIVAGRELVKPTIGVDASYWRNITLNTIRPEPAAHGFDRGAVLLEYDRLGAGETLFITLEAQVNPVLGQYARAQVRLLDGETVLAEVPLQLKVLP
jgi:hypothetical protein